MELHTIAPFLDYYDSMHARTRRVITHIPPDRLEWSHADGRFTFGDLVRHLAGVERWMWAENAQGKPSRYPGHGREHADGYDEVVAYYDRLTADARAIFAGLSPDQLKLKCETPGGARITVWKWLRSMLEHEAHHRGQIHMMLSMIGVKAPPLYGLTEEEVRARSTAR